MSATRPAREILHAMRSLPFASLQTVAPGTSLILAPHPDDESLGCGGLIAAATARGTPPVIVCVTDGAASHPGSTAYPPARLASLRQDEMRTACALLGVHAGRVHFLGLPDAAAPRSGAAFNHAISRIVALIRHHDVKNVFAPWPHDPHIDHETAAAMAAAAASQSNTGLRYYPVWGWLLPEHHDLPDAAMRGLRLDITPYMAAKRAAIAAHASQYTDLITDSPEGFRLPPALLAVFDHPYEVFIAP
jgi:LmbE family N-acetylglucosaminyl deacetylase